MKKLTAILLLVAIVASSLAFPVFADGERAKISVETVDWAKPGETFEATVSISNNPGIASLGITLYFGDGIILTGARAGDAFSDASFTAPKQLKNGGTVTGACRFAWVGSDNIYENGTLLTLTFKVADWVANLDDDQIDCEIGVFCEESDVLNERRQPVAVDIQGCEVPLITYTPGDVDANGIINMLDVLLLCQFYIDGCVCDPDGYNVDIDIRRGDVDGNGIINMLDILMLCQYFVDGCKYDPNGYGVKLVPGKSTSKFSVTFVDWDGTVLKAEKVKLGASATPPEDPTREGYNFVGWDGDYTNITADVKITAKYKLPLPAFVVKFVDYKGTVLKNEEVEQGGAATAPTVPTREGYRFTGWDKDFSNVTADLTVTAQYIQQFTVTFKDYDGKVLKTEPVDINGNATEKAPTPTRTGYRFTGWDKDITNITENTEVTAQYIQQFTVTFKDYDGTVLKDETVEQGGSATAPADPTREGYNFTGWDNSFENITSDLTITATYEFVNVEYAREQLLLAVEYFKTEDHSAQHTIYVKLGFETYSYEASQNYIYNKSTNVATGQITIKEDDLNYEIVTFYENEQLNYVVSNGQVTYNEYSEYPISREEINEVVLCPVGDTSALWTIYNYINDKDKCDFYTTQLNGKIVCACKISTEHSVGTDRSIYYFNNGMLLGYEIDSTSEYAGDDYFYQSTFITYSSQEEPAVQSPTLSVTNASGAAGETVTVTVSVENNTEAQLNFTITCSDPISLNSAKKAQDLLLSKKNNSNAVTVSSTSAINGDMFTLTFQIAEGAAAGTYEFSISGDLSASGTITVTATDPE